MTLKVKEWVINKAQETATRYNTFIDFERNEEGMAKVEDGFLTVYVEEVVSETAKAIQIVLGTGSVLGSSKGWKMWVPKSQIA